MGSRQLTKGQVSAGIGIVAGLIFGLEGILDAPGSLFAITGVIFGAIFALLAIFWRRA